MEKIDPNNFNKIKVAIFENSDEFKVIIDKMEDNYLGLDYEYMYKGLFNDLYYLFDHNSISKLSIKPPTDNLKILLESKIFYNFFDQIKLGKLLLTYSESSNHICVETLLYGRKKNKVDVSKFINQTNHNGLNSLSFGIRNNNLNLVKLLTTDERLNRSINLNYDNSRPFYECVLYKRLDILKYLIFDCNIPKTKEINEILKTKNSDNEAVLLATKWLEVRDIYSSLNDELPVNSSNEEIKKV